MNNKFFEQHEMREIIDDIARIAGYLWQKGWAERNAGNISVNITHLTQHIANHLFETSAPVRLSGEYPWLANNLFICTGTGSRMRDLAREPLQNICFIKVDPGGKTYSGYCTCNQNDRMQPTSELPTHLAIQSLLSRNKPEYKAVVHTHALELIALTQIREYKTEKTLNRLLMSMHPETSMYVPAGVGIIPFMIPGTQTIAEATIDSLNDHDAVVWEKHGVLAVGKTVSEAFDLIDILAKSAEIFFTCRNAGFEPEGIPG